MSFIGKLLETSIIFSLLILLVFIVNMALGNKYKAKWRYKLWIILTLSFIIPIKPDFNIPFSITVNKTEVSTNQVSNQNSTNEKTSSEDTSKSNNSVSTIVFFVWLLGVISSSIYSLRKNIHTKSIINRWSSPSVPQNMQEIFQSTKDILGIEKSSLELRICKLDITPMVIGIKNPRIIIPNKDIPEDELQMILKHELIHYKRHDILVKLIGVMVTSIYWFNPLVHLMNYKLQIECEASCDEEALNDLDIEERLTYAEAIIGIIETKPTLSPTISNSFYGGKKGMKKRLSEIMKIKKSNLIGIPLTLGGVVLTLSIFSNSVVASSDTHDTNISPAPIITNHNTNFNPPTVDKQNPTEPTDNKTPDTDSTPSTDKPQISQKEATNKENTPKVDNSQNISERNNNEKNSNKFINEDQNIPRKSIGQNNMNKSNMNKSNYNNRNSNNYNNQNDNHRNHNSRGSKGNHNGNGIRMHH